MTKPIDLAKKDEYSLLALEWASKKNANDEEGASIVKEKLLRLERELGMTAEEIINSNTS